MRKLLFFLPVLLLVIACSGDDKVPKGILPRAKMQEVMWDMISAGEFLNGYILNKDSVDKFAESSKVYGQVLQFHRISRQEFDKSYLYYRQHPQLMKEIFDTLSKRQIMPAEANAAGAQPVKEPETTRRADTIKYIDTFAKRRDSLRTRLRKKISPAERQ